MKINLKKAVKFPGHVFFEKVALFGFTDFHGLYDDLKII